MSIESEDRRIIRTKQIIRNVLSELIEEKGFNNITITELTKRANINRGTFYLHYTDKYDLLDKIENEVIQEILEYTKNINSINLLNIEEINEPIPFIEKLFEYFKDNARFVNAILSPKGDPNFQNKLQKLMKKNIFENKQIAALRKVDMLVPEEYFISYLLSAHLGVIQKWLENGVDKSPKEMALILSKMSILGPFKAVNLKK